VLVRVWALFAPETALPRPEEPGSGPVEAEDWEPAQLLWRLTEEGTARGAQPHPHRQRPQRLPALREAIDLRLRNPQQLQAAARLPNSGVSEIAVNSALSMIESEQPRNETECAIVIQMACVHSATMAVLGRIGGGHGGDRHVLAAATAASRLSRTFAILVETLRRLRNGGSQYVRVEHIHIGPNSQAVIGNFRKTASND